MNLADRLDRLRGDTWSRPDDSPDDPLAGRLARLARARARSARTSLAGLADSLQARLLDDQLLVIDSVAHEAPDTVGLTELPEVIDLGTPDWVYLDTETTGLSSGVGNLAFMVGVARYRGAGRLAVRQYLLGGFSAERSMLADLVEWIGSDAVLVSYNGRCFDLPLLIGRCRLQRIDNRLAGLRHLDLMYGVRRAYRQRWPDCRLQTAERRLLNLHRVDDLPGALVPAAWQQWLRDGRAGALRKALRHNRQDVVSLALLHRRLVDDLSGEFGREWDPTAVGTAWLEAGRADTARRVWESAGERLDDRGRLRLAGLYRRQGEWEKAEALWRGLSAQGVMEAARELSKYYEHRRRDYREAMAFAQRCDPPERMTRLARLQRKLGGGIQLPLPTAGCQRGARKEMK